MQEKFYIVRTDYYGESWLYGMTKTLAEAVQFIHDEGIYKPDTAIECCKGDFPFDYQVTKTMFAKG